MEPCRAWSHFLGAVLILASAMSVTCGHSLCGETEKTAESTPESEKGAAKKAPLGLHGRRSSFPLFTGISMPTPPSQGKPWEPTKAKLADVVVSATKVLFEQGLADPRGCEYREIEVATGSCRSGDGGVVTTHGWVLPSDEEGRQ